MKQFSQLLTLALGLFTASGQTAWLTSYQLEELLLGINLSEIRGTGAGISFIIEYKGADGVGYPLYAPTALTAVGKIEQSIGEGLQTNAPIGDFVRLRWVVAGTAVATTVTTGANSATQLVGSTANMNAGDSLHFATAAVDRIIDHVVDATHVVLTTAVNSTTSEAVTVNSTPDFTFSASLQGR